MATGRVIRFDEVRGYGFIAPDGGGEDVFVHVNDLEDDKRALVADAVVEFKISTGERGLKASEVRLIRGPQSGGPSFGAARDDQEDDELGDVLSAAEFRQELTEALLAAVPTLTGDQIVRVRQRLEELASKHGWVES